MNHTTGLCGSYSTQLYTTFYTAYTTDLQCKAPGWSPSRGPHGARPGAVRCTMFASSDRMPNAFSTVRRAGWGRVSGDTFATGRHHLPRGSKGCPCHRCEGGQGPGVPGCPPARRSPDYSVGTHQHRSLILRPRHLPRETYNQLPQAPTSGLNGSPYSCNRDFQHGLASGWPHASHL